MGLSDLVFAGVSQAPSVDSCHALSGAGSQSGPSDTGSGWGPALSGPHNVGAQWMSVEGMEGLPLGCEGEGEGVFSWGPGSEIVLLKSVEQLLCARHFANHLTCIKLFNPPNDPVSLSPFYRWAH